MQAFLSSVFGAKSTSMRGFSNETLGGLTVVNFSITPQGLEDQLLEVVASFELRDLQRQRRSLLEDLGKDREHLSKLGETLLVNLSSATGNLLQDGDLINVLKETNDTVETTAAKIKSSEETQLALHRARENYPPSCSSWSHNLLRNHRTSISKPCLSTLSHAF